jgi:hypothetical protein
MHKFLLSAIIFGLATPVFAEFQVDVDPEILYGRVGMEHTVAGLTGDIGFTPGITFYEALIDGYAGVPVFWTIVFQLDAEIFGPTPINSLELFVTCLDSGGEMTSLITLAPYSVWYIPGPANPPAEFTYFPDLNLPCDEAVDADDSMPTRFALNNAYPNPFNPTTAISFALPQAEQVSLSVFNIAGQEVASLATGMMEAGTHSVTFDAAQLGSGVYLYTLQAGPFSETKKMVLVK